MSATSFLWALSRAWYTTPVISTASPARRSLTTSSVRGVVIFLTAIVPPLSSELDGLVPLGVALHVDGHRHAGDVAGHLLDEHGQRGGAAAEALRPDAESVDALEQLGLHPREARIGMHAADVAQQRLLGQDRDQVDGAADAHADDHRRARVAARAAHGVDDGLAHAGPTLRRLEHVEAAHVLGAAALGHHSDADLVPRHDARVDDRRRVVLGVAARVRRLLGDGLAQVAVAVALAHALGDGVVEVAADEVHVLPHLGEEHGVAGVLADRHAVGGGDVGVLDELAEDLLAGRRLLGLPRRLQRVVDVPRQIVVGRDAHVLHGRGDLAYVEVTDSSHSSLLSS